MDEYFEDGIDVLRDKHFGFHIVYGLIENFVDNYHSRLAETMVKGLSLLDFRKTMNNVENNR
jgi:hypothetical protein